MISSKYEFIGFLARTFQNLKFHCVPIVLSILLFYPCATALAITVTLHLENTDTSVVVGHKIYVREADSGYDFSNPTWQGSNNICTIEGLKEDTTYYFVARTYDKDGNTSANSNEIQFHQVSPENPDTSPDDGTSAEEEENIPEEPDQEAPAPISESSESTGGPELSTDDLNPSDIAEGQLAATQWRVYREADNLCVFDATVAPATNEIELPNLIIEKEKTYYYTARYSTGTDQTFEWTPKEDLVDTSQGTEDINDNGIPDEQEADPTLDLDADGTPDFLQEEMHCIKTASGEGHIALSLKGESNIISIEQIETLQVEDLKIKEDIAVAPKMPLGLVNYRMLVNRQGAQAKLVLYMPQFINEAGRFFYYSYDNIHGWRNHTKDISKGKEAGTIVLKVTDGGAGDADGVANGIIVNQSGPATTHATGIGGGSSSRACFVDTLF